MRNLFRAGPGPADFFTCFEEAAKNNVAGARLLEEVCRDPRLSETLSIRLHDLEHRGDQISHRVYEQLHGVFMPPIDREDIITLTSALDDVMDGIHAAGDAMCVYNIQTVTGIATDLARTIVACTEEVERQMPHLRTRRMRNRIHEGVVEINRLENQADDLLRQGLIDLFRTPHDPLEVLAWSKIYETMERVTDKCEDIADVLRGLVIKHG